MRKSLKYLHKSWIRSNIFDFTRAIILPYHKNMIERKDQFETMTIVITLNILHNNYNTITASIF